MHEARRVARNLLSQRIDEWDCQRAGVACFLGERGHVERRALAGGRDGFSVLGREKRGKGAGASERAFEARHGGEQTLVAERVGAALVGEDELEAQKSKKTVSFLPWSTTFQSRVPSLAGRAISVARRSAGTRARMASSPFAGSFGDRKSV